MICFLRWFLAGIPLILSAASYSFEVPCSPDSAYQSEISVKSSREYQFRFSGFKDPVLRKETVSVVFFGELKVVENNSGGLPTVLNIIPAALSGYINGKTLQQDRLAGKNILADLNKFPCRFQLSGTKKEITGDDRVALASIFRTQSDSAIRKILGPPRELYPGCSWQLSKKELLAILKKRGLLLKEENISAVAVCQGKGTLHNILCWKLLCRVETSAGTEPDFRIKIELFLPCSPSQSGFWKSTFDSVEVVNRRMPEDDPLSSGSHIRVITKETFTILLQPLVPRGQEKEPSSLILK